MNIIALFAGEKRPLGACEIYRVTMPLSSLCKTRGHRVSWIFLSDYTEYAQQTQYRSVIQDFKWYNIWVFPRLYVENEYQAEMIDYIFTVIKMYGGKVIYETDDDYTNRYRVVHNGDIKSVLRGVNAITVTTPYLADTMKEYAGKPVYSLPNCVDKETWGTPRSERHESFAGKVVIALTGSPTHKNDWQILQNVLPRIAEREDVVILNAGYNPEYLAGMPNTIYMPPVNYNTYVELIRSSDIVLCPVDPKDGFNMGKSDIKAVEGMAATRMLNGRPAGAAVIATNNPVYRLSVQHERNGLLVGHTENEWYNAINRLLINPELRERLQYGAHDWVWAHRDIDKVASQWDRVYRKVLASRS